MVETHENRYLPVFVLLAAVVTLQSFLIGEDGKVGAPEQPVLTRTTTFVTRQGNMPGSIAATAPPSVPLVMNRLGGDPERAPGTSSVATSTQVLGLPVPNGTLEEGTPGAGEDEAMLEGMGTGSEPASASATGTAPTTDATTTSAAPAGYTTCEVDVGDNLWKIAKRFRISPEDVLRANKLPSGVLMPGQVLMIPASPAFRVPAGYEVYRVGNGETAIDIATRLNVPLIDLVRENDLASLYRVPPGTLLRYRKPGTEKRHREATGRDGHHQAIDAVGLLPPVPGRIGDRFGWRLHPILGETLFHTGVDLRGRTGEAIRASQDGRVIFAGWLRGYGEMLVLRHADGYTTRYAHCSRLLKKRGERVKRGERIAKVGSSGLTTGPHVHFEVRQWGRPLNPIKYLNRGSRRRG